MRRSHTLEFKAAVINDYSSGNLGVNACARKHGISESTLRTFMKQTSAPAVAGEPGAEEEALEELDIEDMSDDDEVASIVSDADFQGF